MLSAIFASCSPWTTSTTRSPGSANTAPRSSMRWSTTKTCIGSVMSEAPRASSSGWPSKSADGRRAPLRGAWPPGLVLVREPDELGLERTHAQLALSAGLIELAEPDRHIATDDDRPPVRLDDDHLHAARMSRRRHEAESGHQLELAVHRLVAHAG